MADILKKNESTTALISVQINILVKKKTFQLSRVRILCFPVIFESTTLKKSEDSKP